MLISEASDSDLQRVLEVEREAFGQNEEAELVAALMEDPTARPLLSLLAWDDGRAIGHILFTSARIETELTGADAVAPATTATAPHTPSLVILAPLAVTPDHQGQGVGGRLIAAGLDAMRDRGVDLVLVAGHPDYYPRHGFTPALPHGLAPPYPLPPGHEDAWMVRALRDGVLGVVRGRVACAESLSRPEYWRE